MSSASSEANPRPAWSQDRVIVTETAKQVAYMKVRRAGGPSADTYWRALPTYIKDSGREEARDLLDAIQEIVERRRS